MPFTIAPRARLAVLVCLYGFVLGKIQAVHLEQDNEAFASPCLNAGGTYFSLDQPGLALSRYHKTLAAANARGLEADLGNINVT